MKIYKSNIRPILQRRMFKLSKSHLQFEKNLYSYEEFKNRLAIEKRRSERSSYKTSILFFNAKHFICRNGNHDIVSLKDVTKVICHTIRKTDVVLLYRNQTIVILLPDTNTQGAQCACKRMIKKIIERYSAFCQLIQDDFHFKILSFPDKKVKVANVANDFADAVGFEHTEMFSDIQIPYKMTFKQDYFDNPNICISSLNSSAISMQIDEIFFWDQELVSKFLRFGKKSTKRTIDIVGSIAALVLLSPVMLLIALAIRMTSPGPILFKQRRAGYKGNYFTFLKFRTMLTENESSMHEDYVKQLINGEHDHINNGTKQDPCFKIINDPRITPLGKFLRKTSLDELPQFFNVLKGEMSIVGPRPPIPYEVNEYKNWHLRRILEVKPGITGLWQVTGRNRTSFDEMVRLDIKYAENWSLAMDLKIMFKTVKVVFVADGK